MKTFVVSKVEVSPFFTSKELISFYPCWTLVFREYFSLPHLDVFVKWTSSWLQFSIIFPFLVGKIFVQLWQIGLSATTIASSFGKPVSENKELEDYKPEDISRSLLRLISNNIAQVRLSRNMQFCGCYLRTCSQFGVYVAKTFSWYGLILYIVC